MSNTRFGCSFLAEVFSPSGMSGTMGVLMRFAFLFFLAIFLGAGCKARHPDNQADDIVATATDALGRKVSLRQYPRRIVSMAPSNTEILLALGLRERLVGITDFYGFPEKVRGTVRIGGYTNPSVEKIVSLQPDLVFAARGNPRDAIEQLRHHGLKVFTLDTKTVSELLADMKKVAVLTGTAERASRLVSGIEEEIRDIQGKIGGLSDRQKPRVLWVGQKEPLRTAGPGTLVDELIRLAGGKNVAGDARNPWPSYSVERLVLDDPEVIILGEDKYKSSPERVAESLKRLENDSVWRNTSAVKERRVHYIPADILGQPSPAFVKGMALLAKLLHPDLFAGQDAQKPDNTHGEAK